ncbi:DUF2382 domain-containing protein [Laspinema olomoucense]|uniref:DUF2382 domain-containing protein n=1 Tax=Laspinema olomoucense D3b TaxID=2953688 RepID=A0ABT2N819_9CYAN|nr:MULTISPECIES: DUF2382 domain-containing protein [unclassified Laspinema]MCT7978835.1 DUF2382 domain-containing protein [Laspinema sp. D3b]MCT7996429.1 DUF2382 domain-containing protein [Laspinema sp. D3c]
MALVKIHDFYPNYRDEIFGGTDIKGMDIYAGTTDEKIGTVHDILLDDTGRFRYLVVDTGFWIFGKKVLLPIGSARIDYDAGRIYAIGLVDKNQAEQLPEYDELQPIDYDYEERVRGVYRDRTAGTTAGTTAAATPAVSAAATRNRDTYNYDQEPHLYDRNDTDHRNIKLYEERLIANKNRYKAGEVSVGKRVETEVARAAVPVEKERIVIERTSAGMSGAEPVAPGTANFQEGEIARAEVYEETADIHKEAFVRENVEIHKEVERDMVEGQETLRREELQVDTEGKPVVERRPRQ